MSIHVHLERFEGPLGLLLHLIREQEMDIFNININHITRQYLDYIKTMRRLDLEVAGEFIAMAATLLHIKSRMLLPQYTEEGEEIQEDPRKELVQKLLEYKKIKELSVDLYRQPLLGRDVYPRGSREDVESLEEGELVLEEKPLFSLIAAYRTALKNMKKTVHRVLGDVQSISARILEIKDLLLVGKRILFGNLITDPKRESAQVLVTFLSLLELAKMGFISMFQAAPFADLHIETKRVIDRDIITQVENYDSVNAEQVAASIFNEAQQISLEESEVLPEDEVEPGEVAVEEPFADAATDEEIAQEEQLLFGPPEETVAMVDQITTDTDTDTEIEAEELAVEPGVIAAEELVADDTVIAPPLDPEIEAAFNAPEPAPAPIEPQKSTAAVDAAAKAAAKAAAIAADLAFLTVPDVPDSEPGVDA